ncbi:MAG: hypothetical protein AB7L92_05955 [Alphaproteobacteria bacterium]
MIRYRLIFLAIVLTMTSGYRFRCWWACQDQTAIQHDYVEMRDHCRSYAQLKLDMVMRNKNLSGGKSQKEQLINLFSECMEKKGWDIPSGREEELTKLKEAEEAELSQYTKEERVARKQQQSYALSRRSECAFARHAAANSRVQAARARACDIECNKRLQESPDSPRPAACPSGADPEYANGVEKVY